MYNTCVCSTYIYIYADFGVIGDVRIEPLLQYAMWKTVGRAEETA
jgi:hypothetical protein